MHVPIAVFGNVAKGNSKKCLLKPKISSPIILTIARSLGNTCAKFMFVTLPFSVKKLQIFDSSEDPEMFRTRFTVLAAALTGQRMPTISISLKANGPGDNATSTRWSEVTYHQ